jgi:hypothetical protein
MRFETAVGIFCCIATGSSSCGAREAFHFYQTGNAWRSAPSGTKPDEATAVADVVCRNRSATVKIIWYSESGDWAAYDTYSSIVRKYFHRTLKFAQFPVTAIVEKASPFSKAIVRVDGPPSYVAEFEKTTDIPEVHTFNRAKDFPFMLPRCARSAFAKMSG